VRRYYERLWNAWDESVIDELIAPDITFRGSLGITVQGIAGFRGYVNTMRAAFPDFHNRIDDLIAEDDRVVARLTYSGTHRGEIFGLPPTGRSVRYAGVALFRITAHRISEGWVLGDTLGLLKQLGAGDFPGA
jgi:steroid delta-isomerase-like uncharacterized protein